MSLKFRWSYIYACAKTGQSNSSGLQITPITTKKNPDFAKTKLCQYTIGSN